MDIAVYDKSGKKGETIALSDKVFGARLNRDLIVQVATAQMSNKRQVIAHTKSRADVRGGGRKPWRQKGTGRARHGSIRSPIWVGGGVAHGPTKDVNFKKAVSRSQGRAALMSALSDRARNGHLLIVDALDAASGKTKDAVSALARLTKGLEGYREGARVLVVLPGTEADIPARRATANLASVQTVRAQDLNALTVLSFKYLIVARDAVAVIEKTLSKK